MGLVGNMVGFDGFFGSINRSGLKPFFKSVTWKLVFESNNLGKSSMLQPHGETPRQSINDQIRDGNYD